MSRRFGFNRGTKSTVPLEQWKLRRVVDAYTGQYLMENECNIPYIKDYFMTDTITCHILCIPSYITRYSTT